MEQPLLGKKIAELRKAKGLTQDELVQQCNIGIRTLQRIESGEVSPRSSTLSLIFDALDYHPCKTLKKLSVFSSSEEFPGFVAVFKKYVYELFNLKTDTMKKLLILSVLLFAISAGLYSGIKGNHKHNVSHPFVGTWELVSNSKNHQRFKMITPTHFSVNDINVKGKRFKGFFLGSYKIEGDSVYSEKIEYVGDKLDGFLGVENTFTYKFKDGFLYLTGINNGFKEVWKKVDVK